MTSPDAASASALAGDGPGRQAADLCRVLFPHEGLGDAPYARTAAHALAELAERTDAAALGAFLAGVPRDVSASWAQDAADAAEFRVIRDALAYWFYGDREVWAHLGYPGESFAQGGYLNRGFDDLAWLPEPRIEESSRPRVEIGQRGAEERTPGGAR